MWVGNNSWHVFNLQAGIPIYFILQLLMEQTRVYVCCCFPAVVASGIPGEQPDVRAAAVLWSPWRLALPVRHQPLPLLPGESHDTSAIWWLLTFIQTPHSGYVTLCFFNHCQHKNHVTMLYHVIDSKWRIRQLADLLLHLYQIKYVQNTLSVYSLKQVPDQNLLHNRSVTV